MTTPPPYPADTRAKGWRFELDHERIRQSDTWALTPAAHRPWLLMLWMVAWEQTPCGSLPDDDELIAAKIDMPLEEFSSARKRLLRGWWKADDGRLYHPVLTERVLAMLSTKVKERDRKAAYRDRQAASQPGNDASRPRHVDGVPRDIQGTAAGPTGQSGGSDDTGTSTGTSSSSVPDGTGADAPPPAPEKPARKKPDDLVKREIWDTGLRLLLVGDVQRDSVASFLQGLIKQHGQPIVLEAVRAAKQAQPFDAKEYIAAACLRAVGARPNRVVGGTAAARREDLNAKLNAILEACQDPQPQGDSHASDDDNVIDGEVRIIG